MRIINLPSLKTAVLSAALVAVPASCSNIFARTNQLTQDVFQYNVPVRGTNDTSVLAKAPNPELIIAGEKKNAAIVIDLNNNVLYKYDDNGNAETAYRIASGKAYRDKKNGELKYMTETGVKIVSHVEKYPYKTAPAQTHRRQAPKLFGPRAIILRKVNTNTGETSQTGIFVHGNCDSSSLGKYASLGCIRMDNEVIVLLSSQVKKGDLVLFKRD